MPRPQERHITERPQRGANHTFGGGPVAEEERRHDECERWFQERMAAIVPQQRVVGRGERGEDKDALQRLCGCGGQRGGL